MTWIMKTTEELLAAVAAAAIARATSLCDAALSTLAEGRKTFVKGKSVMVPWSDEKREQLRALQEKAFTAPSGAEERILLEIVGDTDVSEDMEEQVFATWRDTGLAEVARRFA